MIRPVKVLIRRKVPERARSVSVLMLFIMLVVALLSTSLVAQNNGFVPIADGNFPCFNPHNAIRIGEARKPGPHSAEEAPDGFIDESEDEQPPGLADSSDAEYDYSNEQPNVDDGEDSDVSDFDGGDPDYSACTSYIQSLHETVIPPWDARLPEDQIDAWRTAELQLGTKRSVKSWLAAKRKQGAMKTTSAPPQPPQEGTDYVQATAFTGSLPGFYYGSVNDSLGYHRDSRATVVRQLCLADELLDQDTPAVASVPTRATRRKRDSNGTRLRGKSRRWTSLRQDDAALEFLKGPGASEIGTRQPRKSGLWSIDTTNSNAWSTGKRQVLSRTSADVVLMQETKQRANRIDTARRQADRLGWRVHMGPALITSALGTSGGTAVASRKGLGSTPHEFIADGYRHRIGAAWVGAVVKGGVHNFSLYLKDGEGMSDTNAAVLTQLAAAIAAVRGPWIVGGDWNMTPQALMESNWPKIVRGHVHAPTLPTCNDSTYDFFLVSHHLNDAVAGVTRLSDGGCKPHWTVRLYLRGNARARAVRRLISLMKSLASFPTGR